MKECPKCHERVRDAWLYCECGHRFPAGERVSNRMGSVIDSVKLRGFMLGFFLGWGSCAVLIVWLVDGFDPNMLCSGAAILPMLAKWWLTSRERGVTRDMLIMVPVGGIIGLVALMMFIVLL